MSSENSSRAEPIRTLGDIARTHARERPEAIAAKFEGRTTTYKMFDAHTNKVANGLLQSGLGASERIGYLAKNSDHYFELLFGAAKMRAVCLPIGWRLAAEEVAYILNDSEVSLLFVGGEFADLAKAAIERAGRPIRVIHLESASADGYADWRDAASADDPGIEIKPADTALQLYTSGTTGRPKGVLL
ncbi:MAG: AMP-binding protein, partial [Pseudomonadota bacterium]